MFSNKLKYVYFTSLFLLMCSFYNLSFTWEFHRAVFSSFATVVSFLYWSNNKSLFYTNKSTGLVTILLLLWYIYASFITPNVVGGILLNLLTFMPIVTVVKANVELKKEMLRFFGIATASILLLSLVMWVLYVIGIDLPHTYEYSFDDDFHHYINYYTFIIVDRAYDVLPRFTGMFVEPGQMASVCVLLLLTYSISNLPKWTLFVISVCLVLSFSLAGWMAMLIGLMGYAFINSSRKRKAQFLILFLVLWGGSYYSETHQDSILTQYIANRLVLDEEKGIVGNNRTHDEFDARYSHFISSSDAIFGIHKELARGSNWTKGNAGYKVFIVVNGMVGFLLVFLILLAYYNKYNDKRGLVFFVVYFLLGCVRSFWITPYWFIIYLSAIALFQEKRNLEYYNTTQNLDNCIGFGK